MPASPECMDIVDILGIGLIGFAFLVIVFVGPYVVRSSKSRKASHGTWRDPIMMYLALVLLIFLITAGVHLYKYKPSIDIVLAIYPQAYDIETYHKGDFFLFKDEKVKFSVEDGETISIFTHKLREKLREYETRSALPDRDEFGL